MFANWLFRRAHLLMWACMNVAPNRLVVLQLNTFLSMVQSSWLRKLFVDFGPIELLVSLWQSKHHYDLTTLHRSSTRMRPSSLDYFSTTQHGSKDLYHENTHTKRKNKTKIILKDENIKYALLLFSCLYLIYNVNSFDVLLIKFREEKCQTYLEVLDFVRNVYQSCGLRSCRIVRLTKCLNRNRP